MSQTRNAWIVTLSVDLGILIFVPLKVHALVPLAALAVAWISLLFGQLVFLIVLAKKANKIGQPIPTKFYWMSGIVALLAGIITSVLALAAAATPGSELNLAQSNTPLDQIEPAQKRLVVELLRKDIVYTQENNKVLANVKPISPDIYSPASFQDVQTMQRIVNQLQNEVANDKHYQDELVEVEQEFRNKMADVDPTYLQSWVASRKEATDANAESLHLESVWWDGFADLYTYAEAHAQQIKIDNGKLVIADQVTRDTFNQQMNASKQAYQAYLAAVQKGVDLKKKAQI